MRTDPKGRGAVDMAVARDAILEATLPHVPFDGWSAKSLSAGVADAGYPKDMALRAFPAGTAELIAHFADWTDRRMRARLARRDLAKMKVRERIAAGVRARVESVAPHREAVRRMLAWAALPGHGPLAVRLAWRAADAVWRAAGDTATDFNHYTKRSLLIPVYAATLLFWLSDDSDGYAETWAFLDRRIADVLKIPALSARARSVLSSLPSPLRLLRHRRA